MRIAFVITGLDTGGAQSMLLKVLERLNSSYSPYVISLTTAGEVALKIQALGISVEALGLRPAMPNPVAAFRLVSQLRVLKPDVVHTWMYHADLLGGLAARLSGVRAVTWCVRNSNLDVERTKLRTRLIVKTCARASSWLPARIISNSRVASDIHVALGYAPKKMLVVPNGFDLARFAPDEHARRGVREELNLPRETPLVGLIARLDPQKNHPLFFQAVGSLHRRMPEVHFLLAGKGVDSTNPALNNAIVNCEASGHVHLLGLRDDMPRLMAALDVLISSSSYGEAFPNVLGEAMACGVPCVATDIGDSAYVVGDTGRVVRPDDAEALGNSVEELLRLSSAERRALGERARKRVAENFEIGQVVKRYESIYEELAGSHHQQRELA